MDLKAAVTIAARQLDDAGEFVLDLESITAEGRSGGVKIEVPGMDGAKLRVPGEQMVKACKALSTPKIGKAKGTKLVIEDGDISFTLKGHLVKDAEVRIEKPATTVSITKLQLAALRAAAKLLETNKGNPVLEGLHFDPQWVGGASHAIVWVVWLPFVPRPITTDTKVMNLLDGDVTVWMGDRHLYAEADGITQWSLGYATEYPAASVLAAMEKGRNRVGKSIVRIEPEAVRRLCKAAVAATISPAEAIALWLEHDHLNLFRPQDDHPEFNGSIVCPEVYDHGSKERVGVSPQRLYDALDLCVEPGPYYMSIGSKTDFVSIWGGDKVQVEAVLVPAYLPGSDSEIPL